MSSASTRARRKSSSPPSIAFQRLNLKGSQEAEPRKAFHATQNAKPVKALVIKDIEYGLDKGSRNYMEDVIYFTPINEYINDRFFAAFVFDGHGGEKDVDEDEQINNAMKSTTYTEDNFASSYLRKSFTKYLPEVLTSKINPANIKPLLQKLIEELGKNFKRRKDRCTHGSTISGLVIDLLSGSMYNINLGDSQTIIYGLQGKVDFVSARDSTDILSERQRIETTGYTVEKDRKNMYRLYGLNMTKAFGNYHSGKLDEALNKSNGRSPTVTEVSIPKGQQNATIIIASDGLFDDVSANHIAEVSMLRRMNVSRLIKLVKEDGEKGDNCAIIKIQVTRGGIDKSHI